jgi:hypothetical protein
MLSLSDAQLKLVTAAAADIPVERRELYLQRLAAMLTLRKHRAGVSDADVTQAVRLASSGLCCKLSGPRNPQNVSCAGKGREHSQAF